LLLFFWKHNHTTDQLYMASCCSVTQLIWKTCI